MVHVQPRIVFVDPVAQLKNSQTSTPLALSIASQPTPHNALPPEIAGLLILLRSLVPTASSLAQLCKSGKLGTFWGWGGWVLEVPKQVIIDIRYRDICIQY